MTNATSPLTVGHHGKADIEMVNSIPRYKASIR